MFIIVLNHYVVNDATLAARDKLPLCFNKILLQFFQFGGGLGVNIFVLISGYFLSLKIQSNVEKITKTIIDTTLYSIGIYIIAIIFGWKVTTISLVKAFFPVVYPVWWFVTAYILLVMISNYINRFIQAVDKTTLDSLIIFFLIVFSVLPTIMYANMENSNLLWFVCLYLIAARIRIYSFGSECIKKYSLLIGIVLFVVTQFSSVIFDIAGKYFPLFMSHAEYFSKRTSVPIVISSVFIFYGVINSKKFYSGVINAIASTTFGIYLIHMHPVVQNTIWSQIFQNPRFIESPMLIFHAIGTTIAVFGICSVLSYIYNNSIGKVTFYISEKMSNYLSRILSLVLNEKMDKIIDKK